ncbi:hypothetical protein IKS57_06205, partial [bacterium]|nr:hypothetical protein [bacterium]
SALYNQYSGSVPAFSSFNSNNTLVIANKQLVTFNTTGILNASNSSTLTGTYEYSVTNTTNNINYTYSGTLSSNSTIFNYDFITPGNYTVTVTYKVDGIGDTLVTQTETYNVICNEVSIKPETLNPRLGTCDTLSVNNNQFYSSTSAYIPTYQ